MTRAHLVAASALIWAACGVVLVFASREVASLLGTGAALALPVSLWGSALFGFGIMNWMARQTRLGGIYGRTVVAGNQAHAFVGALVLLKVTVAQGAAVPSAVALLCGVYAVQAVFFSYLMFFSSGLEGGEL